MPDHAPSAVSPGPRISVLLPFRDAEPTLTEALDSVLAEDVPLELLAVDDGSTDESAAIVASRRDPRVRLLRCEGSGIVDALETARRAARAPYLARMDADDISLPNRFEQQLAAIGSHAVLGTQVELIGEPAPGMARYVAWQNSVTSPDEHHVALFVESPLCHPSTLMRADAIESVGGYRNGDFAEDYELWLRLDAAGHTLAKVPRVLLQWRASASQTTRRDPRYRPETFLHLKATHLAERLAHEARPIVVWGAGPTGRDFMRAAERFGLRATRWIDVDPRKIGRQRRGAPICGIAALATPEAQLILVALGSQRARNEVRSFLDANGYAEGADYLCVS